MAKKKAGLPRTALDRGIAHAQRHLDDSRDRQDARYMILCNLIETLWANRHRKDYYKVNYTRLEQLTSPQAREIATFIDSLYFDECVKSEEWDEMYTEEAT